jgi:glycosyltransferase involved in cell wall biosynthesis
MTEIVEENDIKITFIIPTVARPTLKDTLLSLINQTNPKWKAIVIFDSIEPDTTITELTDNRITTVQCSKLGEGINSAGNVRNYGIKYATTEWVAFVDDDDSVKNNYVDIFLNEIFYHDVDAIIFRMVIHPTEPYFILPYNNTDNFYCCHVGISFAFKKCIFDSGIMFEPSGVEDFTLLDKIRGNKYKMMISPYSLYFVRNYTNHIECSDYNRVFI